MVLIVATLSVIMLFFYFNRNEYIERQAYFAMAFMALYIVVYMFIPPQLVGTSVRIGQLYEYVPLVSLGAILFPYVNQDSAVVVTRSLGWLGLVSVSIILCIFKIFVW